MGCGIKAMHDDWDDYVHRCERLGVKPKASSMYDSFKIRDHEKELDVMENICKQRDDHVLSEN